MRILLFGDEKWIPLLTKKIPLENIVGIVCASIRTQYIEDIRIITKNLGLPFWIQPQLKDSNNSDFIQSVHLVNPE
jgi:hypothetical protein